MRPIETIPRVSLVPEATPLQHLPRLSESLGGVQVWCKRDDLTWLGLGGNKLRKLEFLLWEALDQGADTIITTGAAQSNHARLTAAAANALGLRPVLVLRKPVRGPGQGNLLLDDLLGAEVRFGSWESWKECEGLLEEVAGELRAAGRRPYIVPMGGSNALGTLGYVQGALEIARQARALDLPLKSVVCTTSSGATHAGLLLGQTAYELPFDVIGISVSLPCQECAPEVLRLANQAAALLQTDPLPPEAAVVFDDYIGPGYGQVDGPTISAIRTLALLEGVLVDPVYTGKTLAGLMDLARQGTWRAGEAVVFLHTGGLPALFAYSREMNVQIGR
ncbi:MAG: D-cysteine desulfhydrase family protein [Chloroflexia bacterium]|nr:D-cysteine desulfhydrase family protein [Chloroflexia bacterium]